MDIKNWNFIVEKAFSDDKYKKDCLLNLEKFSQRKVLLFIIVLSCMLWNQHRQNCGSFCQSIRKA